MKNVRFVVKVNRGGTRVPTYVQRVDPAPIQMTTNRKLALLMGKFTAEDAVKSLQNSPVHPGIGVRPGPCLSCGSNPRIPFVFLTAGAARFSRG